MTGQPNSNMTDFFRIYGNKSLKTLRNCFYSKLRFSVLFFVSTITGCLFLLPANAQSLTIPALQSLAEHEEAILNAQSAAGFEVNGEALPQDGDREPADPALPAENVDDGLNLRTTPVNDEAVDGALRAQRENLPIGPVETAARRPVRTDPFAPIGIRAGNFILRPSLDQGLRSTTNANNSASGKSATISESTLRLNLESDWASHQAVLDAAGTFSRSLSGQHVSDPQANIQGSLHLELSDLTMLNLAAGYDLRRESASDPNGVGGIGVRSRSLVHNYNAQAALERDLGSIFGSVTARGTHTAYGNAKLDNGASISQSLRDNSYMGATLRGGFSLNAALRPFAEIEAGRRTYSHDNGYDRDYTQLALRGGILFDMGEKFYGEFALGYMHAKSGDDRLNNIGGLSAQAAINWSPQRGTDLRLGAQTYLETADIAGGNSSLLYLANLTITRMVRSDLTISATLDATIRDNKDGSGTDYGLGVEAGATYWFNRFFGINGTLRHEFINSDVASRKYSANSIYFGVKMQR